ncbi:MAG: hypothetical protein JWP78_2692 [Mucilaginibacter sp.]|nr:hypothetical protein [Mucilaginibacter sp.]
MLTDLNDEIRDRWVSSTALVTDAAFGTVAGYNMVLHLLT